MKTSKVTPPRIEKGAPIPPPAPPPDVPPDAPVKRNGRIGRVVKNGKATPARIEKGAPIPPPVPPTLPPFDPAPVVEKINLWWLNGKNYWLPTPAGVWLDSTEAHAGKELRACGVSSQRPDGSGLSHVDTALRYARQHRHLDLVMNLAGLKAGVHELMGRRILARESPALIEPVRAGFPVIEEMLQGLLGVEQLPRFVSWLKNGVESLRAGFQRPGLALILVGPAGSGKSLLQTHLITPLLGGRQADPAGYMFEKTDFNSELFGCEHLMMEDPATSTKPEARHYFGERLKGIVANEMHRCHPKGREAITLAPFWRLSMSLNDDPDKLRILPNLNAPDLADKVLLLRVESAPLPMPTDTGEQRRAFIAALTAELPGFLHYLLTVELPPAVVDTRFGCRAWLNPEVAASLYEDSPAGRLLDLVDLALFRELDVVAKDKPRTAADAWEGRAEALEAELMEPGGPVEREAKRFCDHNNVARLLARLAKDKPDRVSKHRTAGERRWRITPPPVDEAL